MGRHIFIISLPLVISLLLAGCAGDVQPISAPDAPPTVTLGTPQVAATATPALPDPTNTPPPTDAATRAVLPTLIFINTPGATPDADCVVLPNEGDPVRIFTEPNFNAPQVGLLISPLPHLRSVEGWYEVELPPGTLSMQASAWVSTLVAVREGDCVEN